MSHRASVSSSRGTQGVIKTPPVAHEDSDSESSPSSSSSSDDVFVAPVPKRTKFSTTKPRAQPIKAPGKAPGTTRGRRTNPRKSTQPEGDPSHRPWYNSQDLQFIGPECAYRDERIIETIKAAALSIAPPSHGHTIAVTSLSGEITVLPRDYRAPLLFVTKYMWDALILILTSKHVPSQWNTHKYDIMHVARLITTLWTAARDEKASSSIIAALKIAPWRCPPFDRAVQRFHSASSERCWILPYYGYGDEYLRRFWTEFKESRFKEDISMLTPTKDWIAQYHAGFFVTKEEIECQFDAAPYAASLTVTDGVAKWNPCSEGMKVATELITKRFGVAGQLIPVVFASRLPVDAPSGKASVKPSTTLPPGKTLKRPRPSAKESSDHANRLASTAQGASEKQSKSAPLPIAPQSNGTQMTEILVPVDSEMRSQSSSELLPPHARRKLPVPVDVSPPADLQSSSIGISSSMRVDETPEFPVVDATTNISAPTPFTLSPSTETPVTQAPFPPRLEKQDVGIQAETQYAAASRSILEDAEGRAAQSEIAITQLKSQLALAEERAKSAHARAVAQANCATAAEDRAKAVTDSLTLSKERITKLEADTRTALKAAEDRVRDAEERASTAHKKLQASSVAVKVAEDHARELQERSLAAEKRAAEVEIVDREGLPSPEALEKAGLPFNPPASQNMYLHLRSDYDKLKSEYDALRRKSERSLSRDRETDSVSALQTRCEQLTEDLSTENRCRREAENLVNAVRSDLNAIEVQLAESRSSIPDLQERLEATEERNRSSSTQIAELEKSMADAAARAAEELGKAQKALDHTNSQLVSHGKEVDDLRTQLTDLTALNGRKDALLESVSNDLDQARALSKQLSERVSQEVAQREESVRQLQAARSFCKAQEADLARIHEMLQVQKELVAAKDAEMSSLVSRLKTTEDTCESHMSVSSTATLELQDVTARLRDAESKAADLERRITDMQAEAAVSREGCASVQSNLEVKLREAERHSSQLRDQNARLNQMFDESKNMIAALERRLNNPKDESQPSPSARSSFPPPLSAQNTSSVLSPSAFHPLVNNISIGTVILGGNDSLANLLPLLRTPLPPPPAPPAPLPGDDNSNEQRLDTVDLFSTSEKQSTNVP
ncbi:hypothetical protein FISHEDRAFT_62429 [Fistulina hepatica ATCC 64428]|nr:hypothetical protein FISHEDRAFT_62429 [Fistulina hepatica ATCC 64428]